MLWASSWRRYCATVLLFWVLRWVSRVWARTGTARRCDTDRETTVRSTLWSSDCFRLASLIFAFVLLLFTLFYLSLSLYLLFFSQRGLCELPVHADRVADEHKRPALHRPGQRLVKPCEPTAERRPPRERNAAETSTGAAAAAARGAGAGAGAGAAAAAATAVAPSVRCRCCCFSCRRCGEAARATGTVQRAVFVGKRSPLERGPCGSPRR